MKLIRSKFLTYSEEITLVSEEITLVSFDSEMYPWTINQTRVISFNQINITYNICDRSFY